MAVLVEDLYFASIISSAAKRLQIDIQFLHSGDEIPSDAPLALLDIQLPWDWEPIVQEYAQHGGQVVGFGPHMDTALRKRARSAGCSRVLAKSKFTTEIGAMLSGTAGLKAGDADSRA